MILILLFICVRHFAWCSKFKKSKAFKESSMANVNGVYPKRWWNFACHKMRTKKQNQSLLSNVFSTHQYIYNMRVLEHFSTVI